MEFAEWVSEVRDRLRKVSAGLEQIAGTDDDMRGYYDDGYTPAAAAAELLSYAS